MGKTLSSLQPVNSLFEDETERERESENKGEKGKGVGRREERGQGRKRGEATLMGRFTFSQFQP